MISIRNLRKNLGLSQAELAKKLNVHQTAVSQWENGRTMPDIDSLTKIADIFGVSVDVLLGNNHDTKIDIDDKGTLKVTTGPIDGPTMRIELVDGTPYMFPTNATDEQIHDSIKKLKKPKSIKIPVLGYVRAGIPIDAVEEILDYEEISQEMASQGEYFALSVKGDSMEPRIQEGDVVIVRKQSDVDSGEIAVVLVNGNDATVKKFVKHENGVSLVAFNAKYEPMFYTCAEVECKPVTVLGKVVELRGKFN